jgi:hypothetical protein
MKLAEHLLAVIDWSRVRSANGDGLPIQHALGQLLSSETAEVAERAYWDIENHAFVQGELFEVSEACATVLIAALADSRETWVRVAVLELLFQIVSGQASAKPGTPHDLLQRCRAVVREGLCLLLREAIAGQRDAALDVIDQLGEGAKARTLLGATHAQLEPTVATHCPLSLDELADMQARSDRASPGPWKSMLEGRDHTSGSSFIMTGPPDQRGPDIELSGASADDQEFIAHAREDVPRLLKEVMRLRALLGQE